MYAAGTHALVVTGLVRGDGARADTDGAEGRDAEQEQVSTGGRQAGRRRPVLTVVVPGPENESRPLWR